MSVEELDKLIGARDYRKFLNTRNELYRQRKMGQNPPTRPEALRLMAGEPNLIRRPVVICGDRIVLGFDPEALAEIAGWGGARMTGTEFVAQLIAENEELLARIDAPAESRPAASGDPTGKVLIHSLPS